MRRERGVGALSAPSQGAGGRARKARRMGKGRGGEGATRTTVREQWWGKTALSCPVPRQTSSPDS